ncbi:HAD hydrolase family protein [Agrobacterium sp. NPDC090283]|uniref:HAD hydrolase family protein n=1 Tax=Agrobacterium sp. NPDC090283 TaxID=3363920 RepID=UPI00383AFDDD
MWLQTLMAELQIDRDSLVAVGDSHGDIPMLQLAKRSYFVGAVLPSELRHVNHWPDADIEAIVNDALHPLSRKPYRPSENSPKSSAMRVLGRSVEFATTGR